ncbi:hypothetical protein YW7DRAFT_01507 [Streptomyces sp. AmelKG-E11A]|nr:hypothetical protein YW7DRAFT_01507 [Streptomyces sp. AmelKG-E11A]
MPGADVQDPGGLALTTVTGASGAACPTTGATTTTHTHDSGDRPVERLLSPTTPLPAALTATVLALLLPPLLLGVPLGSPRTPPWPPAGTGTRTW